MTLQSKLFITGLKYFDVIRMPTANNGDVVILAIKLLFIWFIAFHVFMEKMWKYVNERDIKLMAKNKV